MKPPMVCSGCGRQYHVAEDEIRCVCGQHLFRVVITPDGRLQGPPSMPEHVRALMERQWRDRIAHEQAGGGFSPPMAYQDGTFYRAPEDYAQQMRDWAAKYGVKPLQPNEVSRDAAAAFGRESENASRDEFYASWSAYDAALRGMSRAQQDLQRRAEILELERMAKL